MTLSQTTKTATTPLREQMIADVSAHNLNPHTQLEATVFLTELSHWCSPGPG